MRWHRRFLCAFFSVLLLVSLAPSRTAAAEVVYFTAVNDQLLPLNDETMPFWSGGILYVPHTAMDSRDLGLHFSRNRERMTVVLYSQYDAITFYLEDGYSEMSNGQFSNGAAIVRGSVVFLPLDLICRFFGLSYSYSRITYGYLVRVKSASAVLSDTTFISAASSAMASRYAQYERARESAEDAPDTSEPEPEPQPQPQPQPPAPPRTVCFVIEATSPDAAAQALSSFDAGCVTFLFAEQSLSEMGDLLRRMVAEGDSVALCVDGSSGAGEALRQIEAANRSLWSAATVKTRLVSLDGADDETLAAVAEAGYCPLRFALDYSDGYVSISRMSARVLSSADANGGSCRVFLGADSEANGVLPALLGNLRTGNCASARLNELTAG